MSKAILALPMMKTAAIQRHSMKTQGLDCAPADARAAIIATEVNPPKCTNLDWGFSEHWANFVSTKTILRAKPRSGLQWEDQRLQIL
ncbi:hypothetical protein [Rhizobium sullae]|uniref:hypothetical protein n=1 Tax=Rhizobium sullae TaxID=50338 RepID=UPI00104CA483|nr:hypothetical protein [Rhizobium sullae]